MDASSSSSKHDVFLSFRGEDTREKFTSHLHAKLIQKNIETYIDNRLPKGGDISEELIEAIKASKISVVIFSENYASSTWCLDEVLCILKCKKEYRQIVVPVFYEIDPSHVRKQQESYAAAFAKHEERFKERMEKVDEWRAALTEATGNAGWDSRTYKGTEAEFVEAIAKDILDKLTAMYLSSDEFNDLVGIDERFEKMEQLLCIDDSTTVRFIGILGMGGIGKTTLARVIFQRLSSKFERSCFVENVREKSGKCDRLKGLEKKLFSELLKENDIHTITYFHKKRLRCKKVLVVLDDVDDPKQLDVLAADHDRFSPGSRIIVTTRDAQVLRNRADDTYELKGLGFDHALQLFILNAFKRNYAPTDYDVSLSKRVVNNANGNPLALTILGSFFRSRRKENWQRELKRLEEVPNQGIHNILKISFDGLDKMDQDIFLDIVCLFRFPTCRKIVERRLGAHRSFVDIGIDSLIDKSLMIVKDNNTLVIHDLLKEMGWEIERQRGIEEPRKRSRFWQEEHLYNVLKNNLGTPSVVEGISCLNIGWERDWGPTMLQGMDSLWLLHIHNCFKGFPQGLNYLPDSLKCLVWNSWPWKSLPSNFMACNLVEIRMPNSRLQQLWGCGVQNLGNLKYVDLSSSVNLIDISALSRAPNLASVDLSCCRRLRQVPPLVFRIDDELTSLYQSHNNCNHDECRTLGHLILLGCNKLEVVEEISGNLKELHLYSCSIIKELPSSVSSLDNLVFLNLSQCCSLKSLPSDMQNMKSLKRLHLCGCSSLDKLPDLLPRNLTELDLSETSIEQVPSSSIENLSKLIKLSIRECKRLKSLPELPLSLKRLNASGCISLETVLNTRVSLIKELRRGIHLMAFQQFEHGGCLKLDQDTSNNLVTEFQFRTFYMSIGGSKELDYLGVAICFPGHKIPMWFTYQSESSSINVKLRRGWQDPNFLGFALCAVVAEYRSFLQLSCEANFKSNYANSYTFYWHSERLESYSFDTVFMWYKHENYHDHRDAVEVSFQFYNKIKALGVSACGIRLLYRQDAEELGITNKLGKLNATN